MALWEKPKTAYRASLVICTCVHVCIIHIIIFSQYNCITVNISHRSLTCSDLLASYYVSVQCRDISTIFRRLKSRILTLLTNNCIVQQLHNKDAYKFLRWHPQKAHLSSILEGSS